MDATDLSCGEVVPTRTQQLVSRRTGMWLLSCWCPKHRMVSLWLRRASPCLARRETRPAASPLCHTLSDNRELIPWTPWSQSFFLSHLLGTRAPKPVVIRVSGRAVEMTELDSI